MSRWSDAKLGARSLGWAWALLPAFGVFSIVAALLDSRWSDLVQWVIYMIIWLFGVELVGVIDRKNALIRKLEYERDYARLREFPEVVGTGLRLEPPVPTGTHSAAIQALVTARDLMSTMDANTYGQADRSLGFMYDRQFAAIIGVVDNDYKRRYAEIANRMPKVVIGDESEG